ncbi:MAG: TonB family protein [Maricaulaceae bacterium]|nr:TonB family protein [Maricaulaceae bacterium]
MRVLVIVLTLALVSAKAVAGQDEALPQSVARAYVAYEQALAANNGEAAMTAAEQAWRAAEAENIDAAAIGVLAVNFANLALNMGRETDARAAFTRAADIADTLNEPADERVWRRWRVAMSALATGDVRAAQRENERALQILQGAPAGQVSDRVAGDVLYLAAYHHAENGRFRDAGPMARQAAEMLARGGAGATATYANAVYLAGLHAYGDGNRVQSAIDFVIARRVYVSLGPQGERNADLMTLWTDFVSQRLTDTDRAEVELRLAGTSSLTDDIAYSFHQPPPPEAEDDARPLRRSEPEYPFEAARNGVEGVLAVRFAVTESGRVDDIEILGSIPAGLFDNSVRRAMSTWRYEPMRIDGRPARREGMTTCFFFMIQDGVAGGGPSYGSIARPPRRVRD